MAAEYQYRIYEKKDDAGIFALLGLMWGEKVAARSAAVWDWKINRNPYNPPEGPRSYVALAGDKIIAAMATIPMHIKFREKITTFLWVVDYLADPSYKTVGWRIFNRLLKEPYVLIGTPNHASYTIGLAAKWVEICDFYQYFNFVRADKVFARKIKYPWLGSLAGHVWNAAAWGISLFWAGVQDKQVLISEVTEFGSEFDELWGAVSGGYEAIAVRSAQFLKWKYLEIPGKKFRIFLARKDGRPIGYAVIGFDEAEGYLKGEIADFLTAVDDTRTLSLLLGKAVGELKAAGAELISCFLVPYQRQLAQVLFDHGFVFRKKRYPIIGYQTKTGDLTKEEFTQAKWFINSGDSDLTMY
jgi:hypothetical protein